MSSFCGHEFIVHRLPVICKQKSIKIDKNTKLSIYKIGPGIYTEIILKYEVAIMQVKTITFTAPQTVELTMQESKPLQGDSVLIRMEYSVVSGGTERANLMDMANTSKRFPKFPGYCGVGTVVEIGAQVTTVQPGDRVLAYHGRHAQYCVISEARVTKITQTELDSLDASFVVISAMGLGGVRKLELELGESAMVMGLGLLGMFSVQFLRLSGAYPVIAADLNPDRRALALALGADYALDPSAPDFARQVKDLTGGKGVNGIVEVSGQAVALQQALECASWRGRISLLGCTRVSDCPIDFYTQVHGPGIKLIGAHNFVRPKFESQPHLWTHQDDCKAILALLAAGRIQVRPMVSRVVKPEQAPEVYAQLCDDPAFPMGTVFDWR